MSNDDILAAIAADQALREPRKKTARKTVKRAQPGKGATAILLHAVSSFTVPITLVCLLGFCIMPGNIETLDYPMADVIAQNAERKGETTPGGYRIELIDPFPVEGATHDYSLTLSGSGRLTTAHGVGNLTYDREDGSIKVARPKDVFPDVDPTSILSADPIRQPLKWAEQLYAARQATTASAEAQTLARGLSLYRIPMEHRSMLAELSVHTVTKTKDGFELKYDSGGGMPWLFVVVGLFALVARMFKGAR